MGSRRRLDGCGCSKASPSRDGFVLVLVLALLAICALMLVGIAQSSLLEAVDALRAEETLRRDWAVRSLERILLKRSEAILAGREDDRESERSLRRPARYATSVELSGLEFDVELADESAKINVNTALSLASEERRATMVDSLRGAGGLRLLGSLADRTGHSVGPIQSWGQVFDLSRFGNDQDAAAALRVGTAELTCWGDGKLNVRRASDQSLQTLCRIVLGDSAAQRLVRLRREKPDRSVADLIRAMRVPLRDRRRLSSLLTEWSSCYSVWIAARGPSRMRHWFCVKGPDADGVETTASFCW